jgi:4-amino-4-deoxy-L-arabinose transferase-like glycosyltransferase
MSKATSAHAVPLWLVAAALALPLLGLPAPLIEVDDARYAEVPRAMAASGDWILPSLNAMPYVEKPPLWYWLGAASIRTFGVSEWAARLPLLLMALLGAAGVFWLGSWLYTPRVGRTAALALSTTGLWLFLSHNITLDLPVSVFLLWTTALILRVLEKPEDAGWAAPAAWIAAALAFLSKGLISVLFPVLWTAGLAVIFPKWRRSARRLFSPLGMALAVLIAAPWFYAVHLRRPDFLRTFFYEQHFQRYLTPNFGRDATRWYFFVVFPVGLLPWTAPFLSGFGRVLSRPLAEPRATALAAWVVGIIAFFTTSRSKLPTYILPVMPHACLLAAAALDEGWEQWAKNASRALGAVLVMAAIAAVLLSPERLFEIPNDLIAVAVAFLLALGAAQVYAPWSSRPALVIGLGGVLGGMLAFVGLSIASPSISAKDLALTVREIARPADQVWTYDSYLHGLPFYTDRRVDKLVNFIGEFHYAKREALHADRFGDDNAIMSLPRKGGRTFVAMKTRIRPHFETLPAKGSITRWREFGPWSLAEIRSR